MTKMSIDKFLKFFNNFDWYLFKAMCIAVANGNEMLGDHLYSRFEQDVYSSSRMQAGINFWFSIDSDCQDRLLEFIDKNYGTPLK